MEVAEEPEEPKGEKQAEPEAEAPAEPEPEPSAPPAPEQEAQRIPLTAMLDEREKRQKAERELEEMRRWRAQMEAQKQQPKTPDMYEDPEGYTRYQQSMLQQTLWNERLNVSELMARDKYGEELVDQARDAFLAQTKSNPALYVEMQQSRHPYDFVVAWHKRSQFLNEVKDPDEWRNAERERIRQELLAEASQPSKPKAPPPSMAKAPAVGTEAIAPGNSFDNMFPG